MTKVYISGKINGMFSEAAMRFKVAEIGLLKKRFEVINPMDLPHNHNKEWSSYMREDISALCECDAIYMLTNWRDSRGSKIEHEIAIALDMAIMYEPY